MATTTTEPTMSSRNPFRTADERDRTPEPPTVVVSNPSPTPAGNNRRDPLGIEDEEPPAYTPNPDFQQGEETIELGPRRPFQPPPGRPPASQSHAQVQPQTGPPPTLGHRTSYSMSSSSRSSGSLLRQLTDHIVTQLTGPSSYSSPTHYTGSSSSSGGGGGGASSGWSAYPGNSQRQQNNLTSAPPLPQRSVSVRDPSSTTRTTGPDGMSDFAREFYAAGAQQGSQSSPTLSSDSQSFNPPPGPPPSTGPTATTSPTRGGGGDGKPTSTPTPGHPLMRDGKVLVYPKGYTCDKCQNIGFKHADPSHPCRKCWQKYSKAYSGPLVYAFNSSGSEDRSTLQRPLPDFRPPQHPSSNNRRSAPPAPSPASLPSPPHAPYGSHSPPAQPQFAPMGLPGVPGGYGQGPLNPGGPTVRTLSPWSLSGPPSGGIVYSAGDPRLGGRLCWNCDGRGTISLFLFDESTCGTCGGIGRVFH